MLGAALEEQRKEGEWIEGIAIWVAVAIVIMVGEWCAANAGHAGFLSPALACAAMRNVVMLQTLQAVHVACTAYDGRLALYAPRLQVQGPVSSCRHAVLSRVALACAEQQMLTRCCVLAQVLAMTTRKTCSFGNSTSRRTSLMSQSQEAANPW